MVDTREPGYLDSEPETQLQHCFPDCNLISNTRSPINTEHFWPGARRFLFGWSVAWKTTFLLSIPGASHEGDSKTTLSEALPYPPLAAI